MGQFGMMWEEGSGGDRGTRTPNLGIANAALSQLSYIPKGHLKSISTTQNWCQFDDVGNAPVESAPYRLTLLS